MDTHNAPERAPGEARAHCCTELDRYGRCVECGARVLTHFRGWPLPDPPTESENPPTSPAGPG